jgi:hypothetical protein
MTLARWACIPFSLLGGWTCGRWATRLYGLPSGILAMTLWFFSPLIIGHESLITPDAPSAALAVCAMYCIWNWLKRPRWENAFWAGLILGLAQLTKFTLLILYPVILSLWAIYRLQDRGQQKPNQSHSFDVTSGFLQLIALFLLSILVINLGYGFESSFKALDQYRFQSRLFTGLAESQEVSSFAGRKSRCADTILGSLRIPLPANYVQGIDTQQIDFERGVPSYLRGQWADHGWWYYYLYALAIKEPLGTWCLVALAIVASFWGGGYSCWRDEMFLLMPSLVILVFVSGHTGFSVHCRYVISALPFVFVWTSKVARVFGTCPRPKRSLALAVAAIISLTWSVGSSLAIYPHNLSYFNELSALLPTPGDQYRPSTIVKSHENRSTLSKIKDALSAGPRNGPRHLLNSNIDWGQDLFYLEDWCESHPEARPMRVAYWGSYPLDQSKIESVGYPPSGLAVEQNGQCIDKTARGLLPGWYAVSVNEIYESYRYRYFLNFQPVAMAGYSIYIYHITIEDANRFCRQCLDGN